jgi:hypothetical protein
VEIKHDKKITTALLHLTNYFEDNQYNKIEALYILGVFQVLLLKEPIDCLRKDMLNKDIQREFKDYF